MLMKMMVMTVMMMMMRRSRTLSNSPSSEQKHPSDMSSSVLTKTTAPKI